MPNGTGAGLCMLLSTTSTYSQDIAVQVITPLFLLLFLSDHQLKSHNSIHYHYQECQLLLYATHSHICLCGCTSRRSPVGGHMALQHHLLVKSQMELTTPHLILKSHL
jgi:hypothetical protein